MRGPGKISKATGYKHARTTGRMTQDKSMRMTNRAEVGFGIVGLAFIGLLSLLLMSACAAIIL
jgi:thiol:disulfide interchange protein